MLRPVVAVALLAFVSSSFAQTPARPSTTEENAVDIDLRVFIKEPPLGYSKEQLTYKLDQPTNGTVQKLTQNWLYRFTPAVDFPANKGVVGVATAQVEICNPNPQTPPSVGCATGTLNVDVLGVNDPPVFPAGQSVNVVLGSAETYVLQASDPDTNDVLTYTLSTASPVPPTNVAVSLNGNVLTAVAAGASVTTGTSTVSITVSDTDNASVTRTLAINVTQGGGGGGGNTAPVASNVSASVRAGGSVTAAFSATDANGDALTYVVVTQPLNGTVTTSGNNFTYTPNAGFSGSDQFTYRANDGQAASNIATVTITVTPNRAPTATSPLSFSVETGKVFSANILTQANPQDADGDTLTPSVTVQPTRGTLNVNTSTGAYTYTAGNTPGSDTYTVRFTDPAGAFVDVVVNVTITQANRAPTATSPLSFSVEAGKAFSNNIITQANPKDPDGDTLTASVKVQPTKGTLTVNTSTGAYTYTAGNTAGSDTYTVTFSDGKGGSVDVVVNVTITQASSGGGGGSLEGLTLLALFLLALMARRFRRV
jgi:hypothetical protein